MQHPKGRKPFLFLCANRIGTLNNIKYKCIRNFGKLPFMLIVGVNYTMPLLVTFMRGYKKRERDQYAYAASASLIQIIVCKQMLSNKKSLFGTYGNWLWWLA